MGEEAEEAGGDWLRAEQDLRWCLVDGRGVDGRDVLFEALQMTDQARRRAAFHNGFMMSCRDESGVGNFAACEREDWLRLYNVARAIVGLPPVA